MNLNNTDSENSQYLLEMIECYRDAVIIASAGAYLHNLGKVSKEFNLDHQSLLFGEDKQSKYFYYQHIIGLLKKDAAKAVIDINNYYCIERKSKKHFGSVNDITETVFGSQTKDILTAKIEALFKPFEDNDYRLGDFIEYLGQGTDDARLYFNYEAKNYNEHKDIIKERGTGSEYYIELIRGSTSLLTHLMSMCHRGASGGEKDQFYIQKQSKDTCAFMATPFGFEFHNTDKTYSKYDKLRKEAEKVIANHLCKDTENPSLNGFIKDLKPIFHKAMADNQRPFNNISVHDIGHSGMALLKSALWTLKDKELTHDSFWTDEGEWLRWRLLRFNLDGLSYLGESVSIGDLRVRKRILNGFLDQVKSLLEEEYPVATEIYRDENGSIFVFPDWKPNSKEAKTIKQIIDKNCGFEPEAKSGIIAISKMYGIEPSIQISAEPCIAHPGDARENKRNYIGTIMQDMILNPLSANQVPEAFMYYSNHSKEPKTDICPYCGLRLITDETRKSCQECLDERGGTARKWWGKEEQNERSGTIWLEEIADEKGRLALITGRFFPERFMELDYLPVGKVFDKLGSAEAFARQRRIWETCREFWQEVVDNCVLAGSNNKRLRIGIGTDQKGKLLQFNTYEITVDGSRLTVMWTGKDFVTLENLEGFKNRNKLKDDIFKYLKSLEGKRALIKIPGGYGSKATEWGEVTIGDVKDEKTNYRPVIPILNEPRTFMYLVPAGKAIEVVSKIKSKYEKEMKQVRGRMPLHLGVVYANQQTPLRAMMDAGRRMLNQSSAAIIAEITSKVQVDDMKLSLCWQQAEDGNSPVSWFVDLKTGGDPSIDDQWYTYLPAVCNSSSDQGQALELNPPATIYYNSSAQRIEKMIDVKNLSEGDQVIIYPSIFDFEFLDNAGVRFDIAYEKGNRKSPDKRHRPYYLEQVDELERLWEVLKSGALNRNQIYALRDAISRKREEWQQHYSSQDETFKQFCRDMLVTASWNKVMLPGQVKASYPWEIDGTNHEEYFDRWADYAVQGWFEDVVQLYLQIMKVDIDKGRE